MLATDATGTVSESGLSGRLLDTAPVLGSRFDDVVDAAREGNDVAFEVLWRDVNPALVKYLRLLVPHAADDIAAETWVSVIGGLSKFAGDEPAWRGWLFTIARRRAVDEIRRSTRRPVTQLEPAALNDSVLPSAPDCAQQALQNLDTRAALELISSLPQTQAEAILLRVVAGLSADQVARLLGRTPGAIRIAAHRGLQSLAAVLTAADRTETVTQ